MALYDFTQSLGINVYVREPRPHDGETQINNLSMPLCNYPCWEQRLPRSRSPTLFIFLSLSAEEQNGWMQSFSMLPPTGAKQQCHAPVFPA